MDIKEFQKEQQVKKYEYIKNAIILNIKNKIRDNPYITSINYDYGSSFLAKRENRIAEPIWIYVEIDRYFEQLVEDLKNENITLLKIDVYNTKTKGFFIKKEYKEFNKTYYKVSW